MLSEIKEFILLLFDRPQEPLCVPKGDKKTLFKVPNKFMSDRYKRIADVLETSSDGNAGEIIIVKDIPLPDLGEITSIGRYETFSLFIPLHSRLAADLTNILLGFDDIEDFLAVCCYARDNVNPYLFNYSLSVCLLNRGDTKDMAIPSIIYSFPHKYFESKFLKRACKEAALVQKGYSVPIEINKDYTGSDYDEEHRLAYFREDLGVNLHYWHRHLVYPANGPNRVVKKDRRGELFYYMHQQILSRYNFERLCNHLGRVEQLDDLKEPIKEAYFPKLDSVVSSRIYQGRAAYLKLSDLDRPTDNIRQNLSDMIRWRERIFEAIHTGKIRLADGQRVDLNENEGIDVLGNIVEATTLSLNKNFYGDYHNMGHNFIGLIHDPQYKYLESFGVMGDPTTAMRDPVFYRWHAHINNIFQKFKSTIPSYSIEQLSYQGVTVTNIEVQSEGSPKNRLNTFWQQSEIDLSWKLNSQGSLLVKFTHLQHQPFCYRIMVNNQGCYRMGTCRIFLAPKFQENGKAFSFEDQQHLFIELDKFAVNLKPGQNGITRSSTHSSVTIPFEKTFNNPKPGDSAAQEKFNYCGCGWPQHMLIPKGKPEGFLCQLFVMISNYSDDVVKQDTTGTCHDAFSYCGIKDSLYPDRRSMGYPFDRTPRMGVNNLQQFLTENMKVQDIVIQFSNETVDPVNATMQEE